MILTARRTDALQKVADECTAAHREAGLQQGGRFVTIQLDVSDRSQINGFLEKIPSDLRKIDILGEFTQLSVTTPFLIPGTKLTMLDTSWVWTKSVTYLWITWRACSQQTYLA